MYCKLPMGHTRISRLRGAGFVAALAVLAMACHSSENDNGGGASNQPPAFNNTVLSITPAADGSGDVYVGGDFTTYNGAQTIRIVRLNANGTIDPAFATGVGFNGSVHNIVPAGTLSGNVYVGGDFTTYNGIQETRIVRLNANGAFDPAFATAIGFNNTVYSIAPVGDGSGDLYVGGAFSTYNGIVVNSLVRLNADELSLLACTREHCRSIFDPSQAPWLHDDSDPWIGCEWQTRAFGIRIGSVYRNEELKPHTSLIEH